MGRNVRSVPMAFFNDRLGGITVKIVGNVEFPGIYQLPEKSKTETAINMTVPSQEKICVDIKDSQSQLENGDVVEILRDSRQHINNYSEKNAGSGKDNSWNPVGS